MVSGDECNYIFSFWAKSQCNLRKPRTQIILATCSFRLRIESKVVKVWSYLNICKFHLVCYQNSFEILLKYWLNTRCQNRGKNHKIPPKKGVKIPHGYNCIFTPKLTLLLSAPIRIGANSIFNLKTQGQIYKVSVEVKSQLQSQIVG